MAKHYNTLAELQEDIGGTTETDGQNSSNWTTRATARGLLRQLSTTEEIIHNQRRTFATYSFETHFQPGLQVKSDWRLKLHDGRELYLAGTPNNVDNKNKTWLFTVQERA